MGRLRLKPANRATALVATGCGMAAVGVWIAIGLGVALIVGGALACAYGFVVDLDKGGK